MSASGLTTLYRAALALPCKFCKPGGLLPVALRLELERPLTNGPETARNKLNQGALLVRAQHASVGCCWFSGPIDYERDQAVFWILDKTADVWTLSLKGVSYKGEWFAEWIPVEVLAKYVCAARECSYSENLRLAWQYSEQQDFDWPPTVTIESALP